MRRRLGLSLVLFSLASLACKPQDPALEEPSDAPAPAPGGVPSADAGARLLIFDAGSGGTRAHVYAPGEGGGGLVDLSSQCDEGPALAEAGAEAVLELLPCVEAQLPKSEWASIPARVYATAGMRSLAETAPERVAKIHLETAAALFDQGFAEAESRTIAGSEEAQFAWIAANLGPSGLRDDKDSVGILELGGSSTQIAFVPTDPGDASEQLELDGRSVPLFAASYLHCGARDARLDIAAASCFFPACERDEACAAKLEGTKVQAGAGDFAACVAALDAALSAPAPRCPAASEPRPPMPARPFVLISGFSHLFEDYEAVREGRADPAVVWAEASADCPTPYAELDAPLSEVGREYRGGYCFTAAWTRVLLELYGLGDSDTSELRVRADDPKWTLGAAYLELGQR